MNARGGNKLFLELRTKQFYTKKCSVENLFEHACPTLNHRAENSRVYAALYL
jgi:hypothetical protein